jgi:hypothetical protein
MSATITMPSPLRSRLAAIRWRIRLLRVARGLAFVVVAFGVFAAAAVLADYWLNLTPLARQVLFSVGLTLGFGLLVRFVLVPLCRRIDAAALAAIIEEKYPDLGERLTSAVGLAGDSDEGHGSPLFIAMLLEETALRSERLDFRPAAPSYRAGVLAGLAIFTVMSIASPAFFWPERYGALAQRFLQPWVIPPVAPAYAIGVSPGDVIAACGRSITLSAHLTSQEEKNVLPDAATLLVVDADGKETRQAMQCENNGDFKLDYKVLSDVSYRIEVGDIVSDPYRVKAITPVELAADSPTITIIPPTYARTVKDEETFHGLVDLSALEHSEIRFNLRFTRPTVAAYLEFSGDPKGSANVVRHPLRLSADRQAASWTLPELIDCNYRLILEAEHGLLTELAGGTIRVQPDQPPTVRRFSGKEELRAVLPYEKVPLEIEVMDDIAVAGVEFEYRINDEETVRQPLQCQGANTPTAIARHVLDMAGKVKEDDRVSYRFRVSDNLPKEYQGPHVLYYPADRWLTLKIARKGDALENQEIVAQRDDINRRLQAIREAILQEKQGVNKARQETRKKDARPDDLLGNLKQLQTENRTNERALREASEVADVTPTLRPVGEMAREVADQEMHKSQQALDQASKESSPAQRSHQLQDTDKQLNSAVKRLDELKKMNDRLAQERLDRARLEMLAQREKQLAEQAAELAAKHPVLDPKAKEQAEKIQRDQAEVAKELERLSNQSEPLKQALEQAREAQTRQLAERARELSQAQRDLARAEEQSQRQRLKERLKDLAQKQQDLAQRSAKLAQQTRLSLPVAQTEPLKIEESQRATDALKEGDTAEAVRRQERAANDMERLAQAFERSAKMAGDPKEAARQLEQAENSLSQRVKDDANSKDSKQPLSERLKPLEEEQKAIQRAAERMSVPPNHAEANKTKQQIGERAAQAAEALRKQDAAQAQARMNETKDLLHRLSEIMPNLDQRRQQALGELEGLRRQQDEIARQVERIKKDDPSAAKRLAEAARQQGEAAKKLGKLDAPNQEDRRDRTAETLQRAKSDLQDGRREDVPTSQEEAKRQLDRLAQALRGEKPADERARELAQQQRKLAEQAGRADGSTTPQQKQELQNKQQQLTEQTRNLSAPEAPQRQREAAEAVQRAAQAAQAQPTSKETQKQMEEAARKLDELARQMAGEESDPARAERLAQRQTEAATDAEHRLGQTATRKEQRRQQEIAREAREIHGGDDAQQEKRRAQSALNRAQAAPASERAKAQRQAADALRDLADRLAGRNDPAAKANNIAQQQLELAREVAQMEPGKTSPQQAKGAVERQTELDRQVRRLKDREALPQIVDTRTRMADAVIALTGANAPAQAKQAVARAAESAQKLAERLSKLQTAKKPKAPSEQSVSLKPSQADKPLVQRRDPQEMVNPAPLGLPNQEQSDQARQLARQQRELRDAVQREEQSLRGERPVVSDNPVQELVRQQMQVAKQAEELARNVGQEQGEESQVARQSEQAQQAAHQTATKIQAGALPQAQQAGQRSAEQLQQLADKLERAPRRGDPRSADTVRWARRLEEMQEDINRKLQTLASDTRNQTAQQQDQQRQLQKQAGELSRQFQGLAEQPRTPGNMQSALKRASSNSQHAQQAMEQAGQQAQSGESAAERQSQERAAQALERAAHDASEAANSSRQASARAGLPKSGSARTGSAMTQAGQQMAAAQGQLQQGKPAQAGAAMRQAAQALGQAAQQMAPGSQPSDQSSQPQTIPGQGRQAGGLPDLSAYGLDRTAYAGKSWGDLPGELRTKIVQDMKARYGEDYARMIKSYFEQIADTKR